MNRIVIFGDSFSSSDEYVRVYNYKKSFPILLEKDFEVVQNATPGLSNELIIKKIIEFLPHFKDNDCILIQTTYTHRGTFFGKATVNIPEYQKEIENDERKLNSFIKYNDYFNYNEHCSNYVYFEYLKTLLNTISKLYKNIKIGILTLNAIDVCKIKEYENCYINILNFETLDEFRHSNRNLYFPNPDHQNHFTDLANQIIYEHIIEHFK